MAGKIDYLIFNQLLFSFCNCIQKGETIGILLVNKDTSMITYTLLIPKQEMWVVFKIEYLKVNNVNITNVVFCE